MERNAIKKVILPVAVALLGFSGQAQAATKICLASGGPTIDVPGNPSFIVARHELDENFEVFRRNRLGKRDAMTTVFPHTVKVIDDYFARVTVQATEGDVFDDPGFVGGWCKGRSFRVIADWEPRQRAPELLGAKSRGRSEIELEWQQEESLTWTRVDWAYSQADLSNGLYGSTIDQTIEVDPDAGRVFVRLIRYLTDGSEKRWEGWIDASDGKYSVREGSPAQAEALETMPSDCFASTNPRPVPVNPTFVYDRYLDSPRFLALAPNGKALGVAITPGRFDASVSVAAPQGAVFQLYRLPLAASCPDHRPLRATRDRTSDSAPDLSAVTKLFRKSTNPTGWGMLYLRLADGPWGWLALDWSLAPNRFGTENHLYRVNSNNLELSSGQYGVPDDFTLIFVRITPLWANGVRGVAWNGWIRRNEQTGEFTFGNLDPIPAVVPELAKKAEAPANHTQVQPAIATTCTPATPAGCDHDASMMWQWLLGSLAIGWLLMTLAIRRFPLGSSQSRALDSWSLPQLLAVAGLVLAASLWFGFALLSGAGVALTRAVARLR